jgi:hypothetical protein
MAWLNLMPGSFSSLLVAVSARKLNGASLRSPSCGLMRLDLSADAANSLFVVCLSNPAYAWNDHTKLMFPNGFMKLP